jgi:hypothetical protein
MAQKMDQALRDLAKKRKVKRGTCKCDSVCVIHCGIKAIIKQPRKINPASYKKANK